MLLHFFTLSSSISFSLSAFSFPPAVLCFSLCWDSSSVWRARMRVPISSVALPQAAAAPPPAEPRCGWPLDDSHAYLRIKTETSLCAKRDIHAAFLLGENESACNLWYLCLCFILVSHPLCVNHYFREVMCSLCIPCSLFLLLKPCLAVRTHQHDLLITVAYIIYLDPLVKSCHLTYVLISINLSSWIMQCKNINCIPFFNPVAYSFY